MIEKAFEEKLTRIFFYACRYGASKEAFLNKKIEDFNAERFEILCNEGFKIAQSLILDELRQFEIVKQELKQSIKTQRIAKNKIETQKLLKNLRIHNYKEELLKNLVYAIAWQMVEGRREVLARFYTGEQGNNQLTGKGFEAILQAAKDINKDPKKFALISDLTNNIQIGDLLVSTSKEFEIIEVKTGRKNEEARRLMKFYKLNNIEISEERITKNFDKKFAKQIMRMQKQEKKTERLKKIIEEDKGEDPKIDNTLVQINDNSVLDETFHTEIAELLTKLKEEDFAYTSIYDVVNIGVYKNDWRIKGKQALTILNNNYPVFDAIPLGVNISEPIFAKPSFWGDENIIDIALGKIKIYIGINFDNFIKFANDFGLPLKWSSKKELNKMFDRTRGISSKEIFSHKNRGLVIEDDETKGNPMFVGIGMLFKIIYDNISPLTLVMNRKMSFQQLKEELKK